MSRRPWRRSLRLLTVAGAAWLAGSLPAATQTFDVGRAAALAGAHAPVLVYHPDEEYFPTSPLFPVDRGRPAPVLEDLDLRSALGDPETRRDRYLSLSPEGKAALATVFYRVRRGPPARPGAVVIEYWLYYVWNEYAVRPGLFPFWFSGAHPNDLERIHVVVELADEAASAGRVVEVHASAHEGGAPANRQRGRFAALSDHPHVLVERGAHAGAPDRDEDGRFTPGVDGESGYKILWGIRDRGHAWSRYNPDDMDPRDGADAVRFCAESMAAAECPSDAWRYRLVPVDDLRAQLAASNLDPGQATDVFEVSVHPFKRLLGKSNGEAEKLVLPPPVRPGDDSTEVGSYAASERGLQLGITTLITDPGFFVGGQLPLLHNWMALPDVLIQAEQVVTVFGDAYTSGTLRLSYPIDAMTKVFGGVGVVARTSEIDVWQQDWLGGLEFRLGRSRISVAGRTLGDVTRSGLDVRLFYAF